MVGMLSFYSILVTLVVFCGSQKLNPNETAPNFVLSTLDGPLIYKGLNKPGSNVKGPMIFHSYSSKSGFLEALWNKDSSLLDLIDNSPDNTHYVFLNSEEDAHKTALWMKQRFQSILEKYFTIAKSLERCDVTKPVNADRRSFGGSSKPLPSQRKKHHFPKPHRRIERRSLPDYGNNPEQAVIKTFKQRPRIVRKKSNMAKHHHDKAWNMKAYKKRNNIVYFHNNNGVFTLAGHFKRQTEQQSNHRDKNTASNIKHQTIMTGDSKRQSMKHQNHKNGTYHTISQEENLTKNFKRQTTMKHKENQSISKRKDNLTDLKKHSNNKQDSHQTNSTKRQTITHQENLIKRSFIIHDDDEVLKRSLVSTMYDYLAEDENEVAATDNCHDDALQKRVAEIINGGPEKLKQAWMKRLHFVNESVLDVGNFIPLVLSRWYCSGHGCGLDQVAVEGKEEGSVKLVSKRLDGRYDWLTSPYSIKQKRAKIVDIGDGCDNSTSTKYTNTVVLISNNNTCTYFQKLKNAQEKGALCAVIYANNGETLFDMTCQNAECEVEMKIPGTMIPYEDGIKIKDLIKNNKEINVHFQHTPWWNFFFGIDEQGKLQEVGWLVYPSMIFLSYQAKWLNYVTNLLHDISSMKQKSDNEELTIFQGKIMQGNHGVVACHEIKDSVFKDLSKFGHVYLDMALGCPGSTDFTCPHWDHTVQLYLNCGESRVQCKENKKKKRNHHQVRLGPEIGRWITPFRRRIGRWLTDIRPLAPLFTSKSCTFTMKTVPWAMPWKPSLKLWLTDKKSGNIDQPTMFEELFRGGTFNGSYNLDSPKGRREKKINVPKNVTKAILFATITGHGSDDNNCAEFCVTSHHFQINENDNERVFDNAGTATGCADRVSEGSEPNEHGTWLYGRNGWCDGENVGPWIEDVTKQIRPGEENTIKYNGFFNSKDPAPKRDPGNIIMYSYLIFYTKSGGGQANDDMKNNR